MEIIARRAYRPVMSQASPSPGPLIRQWRTRRRMSQLELALEAEISQRHLSFVESGRARPSRDMVLLLAERLGLPLRERNALLLASGYAPSYGERAVTDPSLAAAMQAVDAVLKGHEPHPAIAVDRNWTLVKANAAIAPLLALVEDKSLLEPPVNVLRLSLHPAGLAPRIVNFGVWRDHILERLRRLNDSVGDTATVALEAELRAYPAPRQRGPAAALDALPLIAIPLCLDAGDRVLSFLSTITVFGTPLDVTLSELAIESFFPADEMTAAAMREAAAARAASMP